MGCCILNVFTHLKNVIDTCIYMYTQNRHTILHIKPVNSLFPNEQGGRERMDRKEKDMRERLELQQLHSKVNITVQKILGEPLPPPTKKWGGSSSLAPTLSRP